MVSAGRQITTDTAEGFGAVPGAEAARDFLLDLGHADGPLPGVIGERHVYGTWLTTALLISKTLAPRRSLRSPHSMRAFSVSDSISSHPRKDDICGRWPNSVPAHIVRAGSQKYWVAKSHLSGRQEARLLPRAWYTAPATAIQLLPYLYSTRSCVGSCPATIGNAVLDELI